MLHLDSPDFYKTNGSLSFKQRALFVGGVVVFLCFSIWLLRGILTPFIVGIILAYFLNPLVNFLEKRLGLSRLWATTMVFTVLILAAILIFSLLAPLVYAQIVLFTEQIPKYLGMFRERLADEDNWFVRLIAETTSHNDRADVARIIREHVSQSIRPSSNILGSILKNGLVVAQIVSLVLITPVVTFYFLLDWTALIESVYGLFPRRHARTISDLIKKIDEVVAAFVRGQLSVCLFLSLFYGFGLTLLGMNFGLTVGLMTGVLSFIPYVGALTGFMTSLVLVSMEYGPEPYRIMSVVALFAIGQFIEGNYLTPYWVGTRIGLHPVWVIFALFSFGAVFGFLGILVAVPVAAALGVLVRFGTSSYKESAYYLE